jgi:predicted lysophospholipase L1 biosynthesis ABC-type transport system permease subunit
MILGKVSAAIEFATMLSKEGESPVFTELRAVDNNYPLYGEIETIPEESG